MSETKVRQFVVALTALWLWRTIATISGALPTKHWTNDNPDTWIHGGLATWGLFISIQSIRQWWARRHSRQDEDSDA